MYTPKYWRLKGKERLASVEKVVDGTITPEKLLKQTIYFAPNISANCTHRCVDCAVLTKYRHRGTHLTIKDFMSYVKQAKDELGIKTVFLTGEGEPFLAGKGENGEYNTFLDNYKKFVSYVTDKLGLSVLQFTNGEFLTREMCEFLKNKPVSIIVSLRTVDKKLYNELHNPINPDGYEVVMDNFSVAKEILGGVQGSVNGFSFYRLAVNTPLNKKTMEGRGKVKALCGDKAMWICNYPIVERRFEANSDSLLNCSFSVEKLREVALKESENRGMSGTTFGNVCGYALHGLHIGQAGGVLTCDYDPATDVHFGHLGDYKDMREARLRQARALVEHIKKFPSSAICWFRDEPNVKERFNESVPGR